MRIASLFIRVGIATLSLTTAAAAQLPTGFVRVTARDSSGAPVNDAELVVSKGLRNIVARGTTDSLGCAAMGYDDRVATNLAC